MSRSVLRALVVLFAIAIPSHALACAACDAGDPTLTLTGTEQPFAGRLRFSIATASSEARTSDEHGSDRRLSLGVAWAPDANVFLSALVPLVLRTATHPNLEREEAIAPGDLELRARVVVLRDRSFAPTHLVTLQVGTRIPLTPPLRDANERVLSVDAQTSSATVTPLVGVTWSVLAAPLSLQTTLLGSIPTPGLNGDRPALELRAESIAFVQVVPALSLALGLGGHVIGPASDHDASGGALFVTAGMLLGAGDVSPYFLVRIPVAQSFVDGRIELPSFEIGAALDA